MSYLAIILLVIPAILVSGLMVLGVFATVDVLVLVGCSLGWLALLAARRVIWR